ncbi:MAG: HpcH/HpaI aldolase family protein [Chloroflexota bacterium]
MNLNATKQRLLRGEVSYGYHLGLGSPLAAEILANCGIDHVLLDTQHGSWGPESTVQAFAAMAKGSATIMARAAFNNFTLIGRLLDEGALGIVVPMVDSVEQACAAASACRLPPQGNRSWGWAHARVYGDDYAEWINEQVFVAVQIESALAVENAEAILATPGVDGCWVGPGDLALSLGFPPKEAPKREEHARALERVIVACHNTGKIPGISATSIEHALAKAKQGYRFISVAGDVTFLVEGAVAGLRSLGLATG